MICFFNKYKKSVQKHTDFFDNSLLSIVPDIPLVIRNKPHNNQLCTDLSRFISAYPVVSHFLRFAWQTTIDKLYAGGFLSLSVYHALRKKTMAILHFCIKNQNVIANFV